MGQSRLIRLGLTASILVICWTSAALAQLGSDGAVAGVVTDPAGMPLSGVVVTVSSSALIEKTRTSRTNGGGRFEIGGLPPGTYKVSFRTAGSRTVERHGIEVHSGVAAVANVELARGDPADVVVVSAPPRTARRDVTGRRTMTHHAPDEIPAPLLFGDLGVLIPGVSAIGVGQPNYQDVGQSVGNAHSQLAIHGGRFTDQQIALEGMSLASWDQSGSVSALGLPDLGIAETVFSYAAHGPSVETGGVIVNFVPRAGGNSWTGDLLGTFTAGALQFHNETSELRALGLRAQDRIKYIEDVNAAAGGAIAKGRLWFWGAARVRRRVQWLPSYYDANVNDWVYVPSARQAVDDERERSVGGRMTWRATTRGRLTLNYLHDNDCDCHWLITRTTSPEAAEHAVFGTNVMQARWRGLLTDRLVVEIGGSRLVTTLDATPQPEAAAPAATETGPALGNLNIRSRAAFGPDGYRRSHDDNLDLHGVTSYVRGAHTLMGGVTVNTGQRRTDFEQLGDYTLILTNGLPRSVVYLGTPSLASNALSKTAAFIQDRWTSRRLTIQSGLRFDWFRTRYRAVTLPATALLTQQTFPGGEVLNWKDLSPRLGLAYDLGGDGRTVLKLAASRYVLQQGLEITQAVDPGGNARLAGDTRRWTDANLDFIPQGDPLNPGANGELGPSTNRTFGTTPPPLRLDSAASSGLNIRPAQWEFLAALDREVARSVVLSAVYLRRVYTNFSVIDNANLTPADFDDPYCVIVPSDSRLPAAGTRLCGLFDLNPSKARLAPDHVLVPASRFGAQYEHWHGFDLSISAHPNQSVLVEGGISAGKRITDTCDVVPKIDNPSALYCHVETPLLVDVKVLAAYQLPWRSRVAATFQSSPGLGTGSGIAANYVYSDLPGLGRTTSVPGGVTSVNLIPPATRLGDRVNQLNLRLAKSFPLSRATVELRLDAYNALNASPVLTWNNTYGTHAPSPIWLAPESIMPGRLLELGFRMWW